MKEDELKDIWQAANLRNQTINFHAINLKEMNNRIKKFENKIRKRNNVEIGAAIFSIVVFGVFAYIKPTLMAKMGAILIICYCLSVIYWLRKTENKQPNFDLMKNMKDQLMEYQNYVKEERKLLKTVLYWYLLPMLPGLILFLIGSGANWWSVTIYFVVVIFMFGLIYYLNQRAVKDRIDPLLADIDKTLASLAEGE